MAMREIEFRGKRKDTGEWVYGDKGTADIPRLWKSGMSASKPELTAQIFGIRRKDMKFMYDSERQDGQKITFINKAGQISKIARSHLPDVPETNGELMKNAIRAWNTRRGQSESKEGPGMEPMASKKSGRKKGDVWNLTVCVGEALN
jgi:hypothetical protein